MFILLVIILTFISIALKLSASSLELAYRVQSRKSKKAEKGTIVGKSARVATVVSAKALRVASAIVRLARDFMAWLGSFVFVIDVVVLSAILMGATFTLFTHVDKEGNLYFAVSEKVEETKDDAEEESKDEKDKEDSKKSEDSSEEGSSEGESEDVEDSDTESDSE